MSIDITFTLRETDLERFRNMVEKARAEMDSEGAEEAILSSARELTEQARREDVPQFIEERLLQLEILLNMVSDVEWQLNDSERKSILGALAYFGKADDLIPDHIPGIGFLDDALYTEIVLKELENEVAVYNEFCQYRIAEEGRRRARGIDTSVGREDWLADKRSVLHSRMRARRRGGSRGGGSGWRVGIL